MLVPPGPLRVELDGSRNDKLWSVWLKRFSNFIEASGISDENKKKALLFNQAGEAFEEVANAVALDADTYDDVIKKVTEHFAVTGNKDATVLGFRELKQRSGEGVEAFVVRLKVAAKSCDFGTSFESEVKLQLAAGAADTRVRQKAGEADGDTLEKLYKYARRLEGGEKEASAGFSAKSEPVYQVGQRRGQQRQRSDPAAPKCDKCGNGPHSDPSQCPARNKVCDACGKSGHFRRVCRSSGGGKQAAPAKRGNCGRHHNNNNFHNRQRHGAHQVSAGKDGARATQASLNVICWETYGQMAIKPRLQPTRIAAFSFDGTAPMQAVGAFKTTIVANKRSVVAEFIVYKNVHDNLLGFLICNCALAIRMLDCVKQSRKMYTPKTET